jgi:hypothetical protein
LKTIEKYQETVRKQQERQKKFNKQESYRQAETKLKLDGVKATWNGVFDRINQMNDDSLARSMAQYKQNQVDVECRFRARSTADQTKSGSHFMHIKTYRTKR